MPQSLSHLLTHLVFSTKDRQPTLSAIVRPRLFEYMGGIFNMLECPPIRINGVEDHIHALFILSRKQALMKVVEDVKVGSSKWIKTQGNAFANFHWQNGYAAFSVSQSNVPDVVQYIANQEEHHQTVHFKDELRAFFNEHGVSFDERYVWD